MALLTASFAQTGPIPSLTPPVPGGSHATDSVRDTLNELLGTYADTELAVVTEIIAEQVLEDSFEPGGVWRLRTDSWLVHLTPQPGGSIGEGGTKLSEIRAEHTQTGQTLIVRGTLDFSGLPLTTDYRPGARITEIEVLDTGPLTSQPTTARLVLDATYQPQGWTGSVQSLTLTDTANGTLNTLTLGGNLALDPVFGDLRISGGTVSALTQTTQTAGGGAVINQLTLSGAAVPDTATVGQLFATALAGNDTLTLSGNGSGVAFGHGGHDRFVLTAAGPATQGVNGGTGVDVAVFDAPRAEFTLGPGSTEGSVRASRAGSGADEFLDVEYLQFTDALVPLVQRERPSGPAYGQTPEFLFDPVHYLGAHRELIGTLDFSEALAHWNNVGAAQGWAPNYWFDADYYAQRWEDLRGLDDRTLFWHYNLYGVWEGRSAGPLFDQFDGNRYLQDNPDVAGYVDANVADFLGSRTNGAIAHFAIYGELEGRVAHDTSGAVIVTDYFFPI